MSEKGNGKIKGVTYPPGPLLAEDQLDSSIGKKNGGKQYPAEKKSKSERNTRREARDSKRDAGVAVIEPWLRPGAVETPIFAGHVPSVESGESVATPISATEPQPVELAAETTVVPSELKEIYGEKVPHGVLEMFGKLKSPVTIKNYLKKLRIEKDVEELKAQTQEEIRKKVAERVAKPRVQEPEAQTAGPTDKTVDLQALDFDLAGSAPEISSEEKKAEAEANALIDKNIKAREAKERIASGKPNPDEDELYPAVFLYNRDRRGNGEAEAESPSVELEPHENVSPKAEGTPKEWREKLRGLIEGAKEKLDNVAEGVSERFTKSKEYLNNRAKEIDAQAEISGGEKWLRIIGEKYNKLSIIHKLGIGVTLGVGAAVGSAFSLPLALVGLSGLVVQRAVGAAGMFVSIEKKLQEKKVGESFQFMGVKERAALDAMLYTAVMGTAINKGLELANEYNVVERTREWLGGMFGYHPPATPGVHQSIAPAAEKIPDFKLDHPLHAPAAEMPIVGASAHGYEGMLKDLMKQLPDKPPEGITPKIDGSDIEKLFYAKLHPENISGAIHRLATDNDFFAKQGNALIDKSAHMTIVNGNIQFTDAAHPAGIFKAAADMHFTAPLHPEAPVTHVETPVVSTIPTHPVETVVAQPISVAPEVVTPPPGAEAYAPPLHQPPPPIAPLIEHVPVHEPVIESSEIPFVSPPETHVAVSEVQPLQSETIVTPDATVEKFVSPPHTETPVANTADTISTQPFVPVIEHGFISNKFDLSISVAEAHIYADPGVKHLLVYGGSAQERTKAMLEYFLKNPDKIIFGADADGKYRLPWHLVDGKVIPAGLPPRIGGFLGFFGFGSWMKAPEPDELAKLIK